MSMKIINPDNLPQKYIDAEIADFEKNHHRKVKQAEFYNLNDGNCKQVFTCERIPFNRLRRITGYLVGSTDRWNDAKRAELRDRVKHGMGEQK